MRKKLFKTLDFLFIVTLNFIDQLQQNGYCIWMSNVGIWVRRIRAWILPKLHNSIYLSLSLSLNYTMLVFERERERLMPFQKDLSPNPSNSNTIIRHSNTRSTPLKLIYIISSIHKPKIKCFEYFFPIHQTALYGWPQLVSSLDLCL